MGLPGLGVTARGQPLIESSKLSNLVDQCPSHPSDGSRGTADLQDDYGLSVFPSSLLDEGDIGISATQTALRLVPGATLDELRRQLDRLPDGQAFTFTNIGIWTSQQ